MLKKLHSLPIIFLLISSSAFAATQPVKTTLGAYFTSQQIKNIQNYKVSFDKASTAKELADVYKKSITLSEDLNRKIGNIDSPDIEKYKWMNKSVPGMQLVYGAEALSMSFDSNYGEFLAKAKKTPQASDDNFFNLMNEIYGESNSFYPKWFVMTWDLGGYSLLGKGYHIKTLNKINMTMQKSPEFAKEIKEVKDLLLADILHSGNYATPKSFVITEINQIINDKYLTNNQKNELKNRIKQLNKPSKDEVLQFNCEKAECAYG